MSEALRRRVAGLRRFAVPALLLVVAWFTFPGEYAAPTVGLDPSWSIGLNLFAHDGFRFGRDLIFTYGPLGFLVHPLDVGHHLLAGQLVRVAIHLGLFAVVAGLWLRGGRSTSMVLFLALLPLWIAVGRDLDYELLGLLYLLQLVALERRSPLALVISAAIVPPLVLMKFGSGLCAAVLLAAASLLWLLQRGDRRAVVIAWLTLLVTGALAVRLWLGTGGDLWGFLLRSRQIASGYHAAMALPGSAGDRRAAAVIAAALLLTAIAGIRGHRRFAPTLVLSFLLAAYTFKHALLRQDTLHVVVLFGTAIWILLVWLLFWETISARLVTIGSMALTLFALGFVLDKEEIRPRVQLLGDIVLGRRGTTYLGRLLFLDRTRAELARDAARNLRPDRLPAEWLALIGRAPVLVVPWEIALCLANDLRCLPYPTLQMYSTYSAELDRWTADRLRASRPEFLVASVHGIDDRNMVWDCPRTWEALFEGWEVVRQDAAVQWMLARRRATSRPRRERPLTQQNAAIGAWVPVPPAGSPLIAALHLRPTPGGRLRNYLLRPSPVLLEAREASGKTQRVRLVLDTAGEGLLLKAIPTTARDLSRLFDCCEPGRAVEAIRVTGPGTDALEPELSLEWRLVECAAAPHHGPSPTGDAPELEHCPLPLQNQVHRPVSPVGADLGE